MEDCSCESSIKLVSQRSLCSPQSKANSQTESTERMLSHGNTVTKSHKHVLTYSPFFTGFDYQCSILSLQDGNIQFTLC